MIRSILKADFIRWLQSKPSDEVVGIGCRLDASPFANYLRSLDYYKDLGISVCYAEVWIRNAPDKFHTYINVNPWGRAFIDVEDLEYKDKPMTAKQALAILEKK